MTRLSKSDAQAGFVLVNALVLVAAMAAAAVFILGRAEESRVTLDARQTAHQLAANLDAFEANAILTLARDDPTVDHPGDIWARPRKPLDLARGQVSGELQDLESRFNLNWLANPADTSAQESFRKLLQSLSIRNGLADEMINAFLFDAGGASEYAALDPPQSPVAGPRNLLRQLQDIPSLTSEDWQFLGPHVTVLPSGSGVNINTASPPVLGAALPMLSPTQINQLVTQRRQNPFASIEAFKLALDALLGEDVAETVDLTRIRVSSAWFGVTIDATFNGEVATRRTVLERKGPRERARIHWRISQFGVTMLQGGAL